MLIVVPRLSNYVLVMCGRQDLALDRRILISPGHRDRQVAKNYLQRGTQFVHSTLLLLLSRTRQALYPPSPNYIYLLMNLQILSSCNKIAAIAVYLQLSINIAETIARSLLFFLNQVTTSQTIRTCSI